MGEEQLFNMLKEKPMSVSELARRLNVRREYLGGYLEALRDSGRLERIMVGRSYVYQPISGGVDEPGSRRLVAIPAEEEEE
ncbi:MAG: hypothetical protein KAH93_02240 [Candidatus Aenigmarchaeota archaeon]|nr:hypothetical protein [Candidatus Aenigmarchaeota archaeon]